MTRLFNYLWLCLHLLRSFRSTNVMGTIRYMSIAISAVSLDSNGTVSLFFEETPTSSNSVWSFTKTKFMGFIGSEHAISRNYTYDVTWIFEAAVRRGRLNIYVALIIIGNDIIRERFLSFFITVAGPSWQHGYVSGAIYSDGELTDLMTDVSVELSVKYPQLDCSLYKGESIRHLVCFDWLRCLL